MAYEGELVKMENGRWARFTQCRISNAGHQERESMSILVAVELDEEAQVLLRAAEDSLETHRRMSMNPEGPQHELTTGEELPPASFPGDIGTLH